MYYTVRKLVLYKVVGLFYGIETTGWDGKKRTAFVILITKHHESPRRQLECYNTKERCYRGRSGRT